jgi:chaperonin GroES
MNIRPLQDRLVVRPLPTEEMRGSLIIPDSAQSKPVKGTVLAAGTGRVTESGALLPMNIAVGDVILYGTYSGTPVSIDGEDLLMMREGDVFAVIEKTASSSIEKPQELD